MRVRGCRAAILSALLASLCGSLVAGEPGCRGGCGLFSCFRCDADCCEHCSSRRCCPPPPLSERQPSFWERMAPPRGAVVYSVPAAFVAQQALAIEPRQIQAALHTDCREREFRSMADELAERIEALSKEIESRNETPAAQAAKEKAPTVEQRLERIEEALIQLLDREAQSRRTGPSQPGDAVPDSEAPRRSRE